MLGEAANTSTDPVDAITKLRVCFHILIICSTNSFIGFFCKEASRSVCTLHQGSGPDYKSDQWLDAFVIVDDSGKPIGLVEGGDKFDGTLILLRKQKLIFNSNADVSTCV